MSTTYKNIYLNNIKKYKNNIDLFELNNTFDRVYNLVFLDIDKTIVENNHFRDDVIISLGKIINRGADICFITGRGRTSTKNLVTNIIFKINEKMDEFNFDNLNKIHCITNNGTKYLSTANSNLKELFNVENSLIDEKIIQSHLKNKNKIIDQLVTIINDSKGTSSNKEDIINSCKNYSGEISIRFAFDYECITDENLILRSIEKYLRNNNKSYYLSKGIYKNKKVFEVSLTNKENAMKKISKKIGVKDNSTLKIGDQGKRYGNDYEFLSNMQGFSVDEYGKKDYGVLPVIGYHGELVKGIDATVLLLNELKIYPALCLENTEKNNYKFLLAKYENICDLNSKLIKDEYDKKLQKSFLTSKNKYKTDDIFDNISGGIKISDSVFETLKINEPNHLLLKIYDIKNKSGILKYSIKDDRNTLLRGSCNYYFGLSNRSKSKEFDKDLSIEMNNEFLKFIDIVIFEMTKFKDIYNSKTIIDRLTLLGIMDNIRNILIIFLNSIIQDRVMDNNIIIDLYESSIKLYTEVVSKNAEMMYVNLMEGEYYNLFNEYLSFLKLEVKEKFINRYLIEFYNFPKDYNYKKGYRVWRETDNFLENVISLEEYIKKVVKGSKKIIFYGMRYGAIELPIIAKSLAKIYNYNLEVNNVVISSKNNYFKNHSDGDRSKFEKFKFLGNLDIYNKEYDHIILEDNILTGRTLQVAINNFLDNSIYIDSLVIVRYPTINRIEHMYITEGHGCPNVNLFFTKIFGLVSPAPYSRYNKVYEERSKNNIYKDELGVFNINREKVLRYIYKNGVFKKDSEVDYLTKEVKNEYIRYW